MSISVADSDSILGTQSAPVNRRAGFMVIKLKIRGMPRTA